MTENEETALEQELNVTPEPETTPEPEASAEAETTQEPEAKKEPVADPNAGVAKAISDLAASLRPQQTAQQQEEALQKLAEERGTTVQALKAQWNETQQAVLQAQLPLARRLGKKEAEEALGEHSEALIAEVEEQMSKLPPQVQANPEAWKEAAYLSLGRNMKTLKTKPAGAGRTEEGGETGRRVVTPGTGLSGTKKGAPAGAGRPKTYSEQEKYVIDKQFHGDEKEYEKYKTPPRAEAERYKAGDSSNAADKELARLTAENS